MAQEEILRLSLDSRPAEDGARRYVKSLDEVRAQSRGVAADTDDAEKKFRGLAAGGMGIAALAASRVSRSLSGFGAIARGVGSQLVSLTEIGLRGISRGLSAMADGMRDANGDLTLLGKTTSVAATGFDKLSDALHTVGRVMLGLKLAAAAAAVGIGVLAHRAAAEFGPAFNRVITLARGTSKEMELLGAETSAMAGRIGGEGVEAAGALYQVMSAIPSLARDTGAAMDVLEPSLVAASTGFTEAETAVAAVTGILNAFNLKASQATEVSDALFFAQQQGVTTFGEIAASIGSVADLASSLGGRYQDVLAILATTADGTASTAERMTQLRGTISAIIKPTEQAKEAIDGLGIDLSAAALQSDGLAGFLTRLIRVTKGDPDVLARMFPQESLALILSLSRQTGELRDNLEGFNDTAGMTARTAETMNNSWERQREILSSRLSTALRGIGDDFDGVGVVGLKAINGILGGLNKIELFLERTSLLDSLTRQLREIGGEIDRWFDEMFGKPIPVTVTFEIQEARELRRQAENEALIGLDRAAMEWGGMAARQAETANAPAIPRPAAPIDADAARRAQEALERGWRSINDEIRRNATDFGHWLSDMERAASVVSDAEIGHGLQRGRDEFGRRPQASELLINDSVRQGSVEAAHIRELLRRKEEEEKANDNLAGSTAKVARGIIDMADAFGGLDDGARRALSGITGLIASLDDFDASAGRSLANIGSMIGAFAAGAQIISGLLGGGMSAEERERNEALTRALEGNKEELNRLRITMEGLRPSFDAMSRLMTAADLLSRRGDSRRGGSGQAISPERAMAEAGLSRDQLSVLSEAFGIDVFDENGKIVARMFDQLAEAVAMARRNVEEFGNTLAGQRALVDARNEIFDITDPAALLQSQMDLLAQQAGNLFGDFAGMDFSDAGNRQLLEDELRDLVGRAQSGDLTADDLQGFSSVQEFLDAIMGADRSLDVFTKGLNKAAEATTDIPKAINLALLQQRHATGLARDPATPPEGPATLDPTSPEGVWRPQLPPSGPAVHNNRGQGETVTFTGDINIVNEAGDTPETILEKFEHAMRNLHASGGSLYLAGLNGAK
jgi:TP901 family phage tail tape measure protein